jgi:hypothetical protein
MAAQSFLLKVHRHTMLSMVLTGRLCKLRSTLAVSSSQPRLLKFRRSCYCPFAVKGGGHAAFSGASNIDSGITVSMENFKKVVVSSDKSTADIGPGNRWVDVYTAIGKSGVGVVGGRVSLRVFPPTLPY